MAIYRIDATTPTADGSGNLAWHMSALADDGTVLPYMQTIILTPYEEVQAALDAPNPAAALKALLGLYAPESWLPEALDAMVAANAAALGVKDGLDGLITSYPYEFQV